MSYMDMTFCPYHEDCKKGTTCFRSLTTEVRLRAEKWWGGPNAPICVYAAKPECFDSKNITVVEMDKEDDHVRHCYQCDAPVVYLFPDARCGKCTRLTPEELTGVVTEEYDDESKD